jgi:hypothetical protein
MSEPELLKYFPDTVLLIGSTGTAFQIVKKILKCTVLRKQILNFQVP